VAWNGFSVRRRREVPAGKWMRCDGCGEMIYRQEAEANLHCCPQCQYHFRLGARDRIAMLADEGSFEELYATLAPTDPLEFTDRMPYAERLAEQQKKTGLLDAMVVGRARLAGRPIALGAMDANFIMASMGSVVGEKVTRLAELAVEENRPLIIACASGGARMQEGMLSLMQMCKTSAAIARLDDAGGLYLAILTNPTTAGVAASFATLGHLLIAEPGALVGFTGRRVIANTIHVELPDDFQTAEFLLEHGLIDRIVPRRELKAETALIMDYLLGPLPDRADAGDAEQERGASDTNGPVVPRPVSPGRAGTGPRPGKTGRGTRP